MKKFFVVLIVTCVLSVAFCAWGMSLRTYILDGKVGESYIASILPMDWAWLAPATISYSIRGTLPPGLKLSDSTGYSTNIEGTPTEAGEWSFTVTATARSQLSSVSDSASEYCTIKITGSGSGSESGSSGDSGSSGGSGGSGGNSGDSGDSKGGLSGGSGGGCDAGISSNVSKYFKRYSWHKSRVAFILSPRVPRKLLRVSSLRRTL